MDREIMDWENEGGATPILDAVQEPSFCVVHATMKQEPTPTVEPIRNRDVYQGGPSWQAEVATAFMAAG